MCNIMQSNLIIQKGTSFIIYGAGKIGEEIKTYLEQNGYVMSAFLDINAEQINNIANVKVYNPDTYINKNSTIVFISVLNVFGHREIADMLYEKGFQYIIFADSLDGANSQIKTVYNRVRNFENLDGFEVPAYVSIRSKKLEQKIYCATDEEVVLDMPMEWILGASRSEHFKMFPDSEVIKKIYDRFIYDDFIARELFEGFSNGCFEEEWESFLKLYYWYRIHQTQMEKVSKEESRSKFRTHLMERYNVYCNLDYMLRSNSRYFESNPSSLAWNGNGFNIKDGNNRIAFLMSRGIYSFPCRISHEEYKQWNKREDSKNILRCIKKENLKVKYPIPYPGFESYNELLFIFRRILIILMKYLNTNILNKQVFSVLDLCGNSSYIAIHLCKAGYNVQTIVNANEKEFLQKLLQLFKCEMKINLYNNYLQSDKKYDMLIIDLRDINGENALEFCRVKPIYSGKLCILSNEKINEMEIHMCDYELEKTLLIYPYEDKLLYVSIFSTVE